MTRFALALAAVMAAGVVSQPASAAVVPHRNVVHHVKHYTCKDGTTSKTKKGCKTHGGLQPKVKKPSK